MTLAETLSEMIKVRGIRAEDIASKAGVSVSTVRNYLKGRAMPSFGTLLFMCKAYPELQSFLEESLSSTLAAPKKGKK